jgi:hypothetical protein
MMASLGLTLSREAPPTQQASVQLDPIQRTAAVLVGVVALPTNLFSGEDVIEELALVALRLWSRENLP